MGLFSDIFNPGKKDLDRARRALERARFQGGSIQGAGGLGGSFRFNNGQLIGNTSLGSFSRFLPMLQGASEQFLGQIGDGTMDRIREQLSPDLQAFADILSSSAPIASMDPLERGGQVTDLLRQRASRGSQNLVNSTFDRLFASGGLSNQVTREQVTGDLRRQLADEDLGFQLAGINQGEQSVANAFQRVLQASQGKQGLTLGLDAYGLNRDASLLDAGTGALQAGTGLSMLPLAFINAISAIQGQRSDTELGIASGSAQAASQAQSGVMNFLDFISGISTSVGDIKELFE